MIKLVVLAIVTLLGLVSHSCSRDHDKTQNADLISIKSNTVSNTFNCIKADASIHYLITFTSN